MTDPFTPCIHAEPQADSQLHGVCIFCYRDRLAAATARADAAERDTARLDWLEANPAAIRERSVNKSWGRKVWWMGPTGDYDTAREAIDAARADAARKQEGSE